MLEMMTDVGDALLQDILDNSDDDGLRLIYADWLQDHGQPARAAFIRVQIELEQPYQHGEAEQCAELLQRERELFAEGFHTWREHQVNWSAHLAGGIQWSLPQHGLPDPDWIGFQFRRGFVSVVTLRSECWWEHAVFLVQSHPLTEVRLSDRLPSCPSLAGSPHWMDREAVDDVNPSLACTLPHEWFVHLTAGPCNFMGLAHYDTPEEAQADLSRACLTWVREKARAGR